ncbi:hypothetical protein LSAT2_018691 [Lamellibrachia satsuma]|nr:hypothetical protein LSAT2_018691 [Lamellibrachia satsuma]
MEGVSGVSRLPPGLGGGLRGLTTPPGRGGDLRGLKTPPGRGGVSRRPSRPWRGLKTPHAVEGDKCYSKGQLLATSRVTCGAAQGKLIRPKMAHSRDHQSPTATPSTRAQDIAGGFQVEVKRDSCRTATVYWKQTPRRDSLVDITVKKVSPTIAWFSTLQSTAEAPARRPATELQYCLPGELVRGTKYKVAVCGVTTGLKGEITFRAEFTPDELRTLHTMAVDYVTPGGSNDFDHCRVFYRNKPPDYFIRCQINDNNIMKVYMKDNNGDPASIINGQINGLFFATSVDPRTGGPPNVSHFGSRRISIPATAMLTKDSNLYFADFYCNHKAHYVTVVLTTPGSETDRFCEKKLIKLDIKHNDFLWRSSHVFVTGKVWVEVLYTEDVDLSRPDATFSIVYSKGTSTPGGLPKNPSDIALACVVCAAVACLPPFTANVWTDAGAITHTGTFVIW